MKIKLIIIISILVLIGGLIGFGYSIFKKENPGLALKKQNYVRMAHTLVVLGQIASLLFVLTKI